MLDIVLECKPDEALIRNLGYPRRRIIHQSSKGEVINYLSKNVGAIGIVDEDPGSATPTYFSRFRRETNERFGIESFHIPGRNTRLIVLKPRLEEWILKYASELEIDLEQHALPSKGSDLHKIINTRIPRFGDMITEMLQKKSAALIHLKSLIDKSLE